MRKTFKCTSTLAGCYNNYIWIKMAVTELCSCVRSVSHPQAKLLTVISLRHMVNLQHYFADLYCSLQQSWFQYDNQQASCFCAVSKELKYYQSERSFTIMISFLSLLPFHLSPLRYFMFGPTTFFSYVSNRNE